jgi:hypothetical protein
LRDFLDRTEADLYLWIAEHRAELEQELGREIRPEMVANDLVSRSGPRLKRVWARVSERIRGLIEIDSE